MWDEDTMWIVGLNTNVTTTLLDLKTWTTTQGPDMPVPLLWMCALKVNSTHAYVGGGEHNNGMAKPIVSAL